MVDGGARSPLAAAGEDEAGWWWWWWWPYSAPPPAAAASARSASCAALGAVVVVAAAVVVIVPRQSGQLCAQAWATREDFTEAGGRRQAAGEKPVPAAPFPLPTTPPHTHTPEPPLRQLFQLVAGPGQVPHKVAVEPRLGSGSGGGGGVSLLSLLLAVEVALVMYLRHATCLVHTTHAAWSRSV